MDLPGQRLNKALASRAFVSRRKADELIFAGRVRVNGKEEKNPATKVKISDQLELDGKPLSMPPMPCHIMLNKPVHCVCTRDDPQHRITVMDILPEEFRNMGLFPVGRLDYFSEGLLILTNDGDLAMRLTHPRFHLPKKYEVTVRGKVGQDTLARMRSGMILDEIGRILPVVASARSLPNGDTLLLMELRQGINRQIRRMCAQEGLTVLRIRRVAVGSLELGDLAPGKCVALGQASIDNLLGSARFKER